MKQDVLDYIKQRRQNLLDGGINGIPIPFKRFRSEFPVITQGRYFVVTGTQKAAKTQLTNRLFVYNTILYMYYNPDVITAKIFYFPLEEDKQECDLRFTSFLVYWVTKDRLQGPIIINPEDLASTDERKPIPDEVIDIIENNDEFNNIYELYENIVSYQDVSNPTGMKIILDKYVEENGTIVKEDVEFETTDEVTGEKITKHFKKFSKYIPNRPNEYVFVVTDHVSNLTPEKGKSLRETIEDWSKYCIKLMKRYNYIPVNVQQQSQETQDANAMTKGNIEPTSAGLADCKYTGRDITCLIGLTNPFYFKIHQYPVGKGYNIDKLKGNVRFMHILLNRKGKTGGICPLEFNGNICEFKELPSLDEVDSLNEIYRKLDMAEAAKRAENLNIGIGKSIIATYVSKLFN